MMDMKDVKGELKGFVVDTDSYSGNFEREMCAYMTGYIGDCEVGEEEANDYLKSYTEVSGVIDKPDEHGVYRPVKIHPTLGFWNDGMGKHYKFGDENAPLQTVKYPAYQSFIIYLYELPSEEELERMKKRALEYAEKNKIEILGFRFVFEEVHEYSVEA